MDEKKYIRSVSFKYGDVGITAMFDGTEPNGIQDKILSDARKFLEKRVGRKLTDDEIKITEQKTI